MSVDVTVTCPLGPTVKDADPYVTSSKSIIKVPFLSDTRPSNDYFPTSLCSLGFSFTAVLITVSVVVKSYPKANVAARGKFMPVVFSLPPVNTVYSKLLRRVGPVVPYSTTLDKW